MTAGGGLHVDWARQIMASLVDAGIRDVVLSPGSRSGPLAMAAATEARLRVTVVVDERSAAFLALGQARVTGLPSALVCTSGSAVAHHHPAVVEADAARVPMLLLTADRPLELHHADASQTIDQVKVFGDHARASIDLGAPDLSALPHLPRMVTGAVFASLAPTPGPVHVNARFRKPLEPLAGERPRGTRSSPRVHLGRLEPSEAAVREVADRLRGAQRALVVAGPSGRTTSEGLASRTSSLQRAALSLVRSADVPIVGEVTSGLVGASALAGAGLGSLDLLLAGPSVSPDLVLQIGRPPVGSAYGALLERTGGPRILVTEAGLPDPHALVTDVVYGDTPLFLSRLGERLERLGGGPGQVARRGVGRALGRAHAALVRSIALELEDGALTEPACSYELARALPPRSALVLGNSGPVRDFDAFGAPVLRDVAVLSQRGAAGIDGLFAGAAGCRSAWPGESPVALLLGDVAALHDVGSLALLAEARGPLVCVVIDNGGGRIFEALPIARTPEGAAHLERLFLTPPPRFLRGAAAGFGVAYEEVSDRATLGRAFAEALRAPRATILEVHVDVEATRAQRDRVRAAALAALASHPCGG